MRVITLMSVFFVLAGCSSFSNVENFNSTQFKNKTWVLEKIDSKPAYSESRATLVMDSKGGNEVRISGNASCNKYFGRYTFEGDTMRMGPIGSTLMNCPKVVMDQEKIFLKTMQLGQNYKLNKDILIIKSKNHQLQFRAETEKLTVSVAPASGAFPADTVVKVYFEGVNPEDDQSVVLGMNEVTVKKEQKNPIKVSINYAPHLIKPEKAYGITVRATKNGRLIYINRDRVPVVFGDKTARNVIEAKIAPVGGSF